MPDLYIKRPNFPEWAPRVLILEWENKIKEVKYWHEKFPTVEPETEEADLLVKLLTYDDMRIVWKKLPKYKIKPSLFVSMIRISLCFMNTKH